jgi:hypothetical protein
MVFRGLQLILGWDYSDQACQCAALDIWTYLDNNAGCRTIKSER